MKWHAEHERLLNNGPSPSRAAVEAIPYPFDQAILGDDSAPGRVAVLAAVRAVQDVGDAIVEVATALGVEINTDL